MTILASQASSTPIATGLDESFDRLIQNLPETIFGAPDEAWCSPELSRDPFTILANLRDCAGPLVRRDDNGLYGGIELPDPNGHDMAKPHYVALTHAAVTEIGTQAQRFINDGAYRVSQEIQGRTINTRDGAEHRLMRRLFDQGIFGRRQMDEFIANLIEPTVKYLVQRAKKRMEEGDPVDICRDIALPMTYKSISTTIGVPQHLFAEFVELGDAAFGFVRNPTRAMEAVDQMTAHFESELRGRRDMDSPPRDLMTIMSTTEISGQRLSDEDIIMHCRFLMPGGIETTWRQTANMFMAMMLHPNQYQAVVSDLSLVDAAVEESLRWVPSGFVVPRLVANDTSVGGIGLPAGSQINSIQGIANRDPSVWDAPNEFNIARELKPHLTFHAGLHFCMGQNLARGSFRAILREMAIQIPNLVLGCDRDEVEMCGFGLHVVRKLPVTLN